MSNKLLFPLYAVTLACGLALSAAAQTTTTEAPAAEAPAAEAPAAEAPAAEAPAATPEAAPSDLSLGQETGAAAPAEGPGSVYLAAKHGDWEQRCVRVTEGPEPCQLYQLLKDAQGNSVAEISLFGLPDGSKAVAGANFVAPLDTLLTANVSVQVDDAKGKMYPFTWCSVDGCIARIGLLAEEVAAFKGGNKAQITIVPAAAPDQKVVLEMSLAGFTAGFETVKVPEGAVTPQN